jgi:GNAT superfamily N-acetyltransferase
MIMRGAILFARLGSNIVGTVALKREDAATFELTKMAVDKRWQGRGLGRSLLESACRLARELLYSHRSLEPAIKRVPRAGFRRTAAWHPPLPAFQHQDAIRAETGNDTRVGSKALRKVLLPAPDSGLT